jgi:integrase
MARALTSKRIAKLRKIPGRYPDGEVAGLYLQVTTPPTIQRPRGAASWILRFERDDHERMFGIGSLSEFSLKEARERARAARKQLKDGIDPIDARKAAKTAKVLEQAKAVTFREVAESYVRAHEGKWRNPRHGQEFVRSLERLAFPVIGKLPVGAIDTPLVLKVLEGPWKEIPETASRVRGRIEMILNFAAVRGQRQGDNPAAWARIKHVLPRRPATAIEHHRAMHYRDVPQFMAELERRGGPAAAAFRFTILAAARTNETLHAIFDEIKDGVWEIPATKMKGGQAHRVPLSKQAIALLPPRQPGNPHVFPGTGAGRPLSKDSLQKLLRRMGRAAVATPHGMRSCFRDWAAERTAFSYAARELALAHAVHSKQSRAYERTDLIDERRRLMQAWADFCYSPPVGVSEATPLRKAARS